MVRIRGNVVSDTEVWLEYDGSDVDLVAKRGDEVRTIAFLNSSGEFVLMDKDHFTDVGLTLKIEE